MMLVSSAEFYAVVVALNSVLFVILLFLNSEFVLWFFIYEISVITALSAILLESRSYRRFYAFLVMIAITAISSIAVYSILNLSHLNLKSWYFVLLIALVVITKIPLVPFSAWLPEAHVEASWSGSVVLAGYALKFCVIAILQFLTSVLSTFDIFIVTGWISFVFGSFAMIAVVDVKKLIANFSIVHVAAALLGLLLLTNSEFISAFSWHHHSVVTGLVFWQVGLVYAATGSRLLRWIFPSSTVSIFGVIWFLAMTVSADLPWTSNILIEFSLLRNFHDPWIFVALAVSFWAVFALISQSWATKFGRLSSSSDMDSGSAFAILVSTLALIGIGFATFFRNVAKVAGEICRVSGFGDVG